MGLNSRWGKLRKAAEDFFNEREIASEDRKRSWLVRFAHFWLMVVKSFKRNRCPVRASSLAYTTLLAMVPVLAVVVSITTSMLQKQGKHRIDKLIDQLVTYVAPALDLQETTRAAGSTNGALTNHQQITLVTNASGQVVAATNTVSVASGPTGRQKVVENITAYISKINAGTLGVTSLLALLFVVISLLRTIEATFNDIWGVIHGRTWVKSIIYYWAALTLGPVLLVGALVLTSGKYMGRLQSVLQTVPFLDTVVLTIAPFVILSIGFAAFYALMPNTRVQWKAALVGGVVGGCLWQLNNMFNVIYVSRVTSYTTIYGSLAIFPLFLVGLYFSWLIMLLGAQVAYAFQNRDAYIEEKQAESVNQRGREFIALRVMTYIAGRFMRGQKPANVVEISCDLSAPSALVSKLLGTFVESGLLVEVADTETCYSPARPVNSITVHDVLRALRVGQGIELATKDDAARTNVRTEFERIIDAERRAGQSVSLEMLAQNPGEMARAVA